MSGRGLVRWGPTLPYASPAAAKVTAATKDKLAPRPLFAPVPTNFVRDGSGTLQLKNSPTNFLGEPAATINNDGAILATWCKGVGSTGAIATGANRGVIRLMKSLNWFATLPPADTLVFDTHNLTGDLAAYVDWDARDPFIKTLADGTVALTVCLAFDSNTRVAVIGFSTDGGTTFPAASFKQIPTTLYYTLASSLEELPDGSLLVACYGLQTSGDTKKSTVVVRSSDRGVSWSAQVMIANGTVNGRTYNEPNVGIVTDDAGTKTLMCLIRSDDAEDIWKTTTTDLTGLTGWASPTSQFSGRDKPRWCQPRPGGPIVVGTRDQTSAAPQDTAIFYTSLDFGGTWSAKTRLDDAGFVCNDVFPIPLAAGQIGCIWANRDVLSGATYINYDLLVAGVGVPVTGAEKIILGSTRRPTKAVAETVSRAGGSFVNTISAWTSGQALCMAIDIAARKQLLSATCWTGATTVLSGATHQWFGLADSSLNVLAKTADDGSTAWAASSKKELFFSRQVTDAAMTSGSNRVTSATGAFIPYDSGRQATVMGAGAAGVPLGTSAAAAYMKYVDATHVDLFSDATLATPLNASTTVAAASAFFAQPFQTTYTGMHYLIWVIAATTMPTQYGLSDSSSAPNTEPPINVGLSTAPVTPFAPDNLGSSLTSLSATGRKPWAYVNTLTGA